MKKPGPSAESKRESHQSPSPQSVGLEGKGRATVTVTSSCPPPLTRQVPGVTRGGNTPYTAHFPTYPQANYQKPRSDIKITVDVHCTTIQGQLSAQHRILEHSIIKYPDTNADTNWLYDCFSSDMVFRVRKNPTQSPDPSFSPHNKLQ